MYFLLGAIFYLAYDRRKNIVDSIVVHLLNNGLLVIISVVNYLILMFG
ncbi:CPBP family glutamic-type intramembrane protease [Streptococcus thermophilus]